MVLGGGGPVSRLRRRDPETLRPSLGVVSFNRSFMDVLADSPRTLTGARQAQRYRQVGMAALVGFGSLSVYYRARAMSAASDAETLSETSEAEELFLQSAGAIFLAVVGYGVPNVIAGNRFLRAVDTFDAGMGAPPPGWTSRAGSLPEDSRAAAVLPDRLWVDPIRGGVALGWRIPTLSGR